MSTAELLDLHTPSISEEAKTHIRVLTELLRDVDLEARMMTLIKVDGLFSEDERVDSQLTSIRNDLELEMTKMQKMLFLVERAQEELVNN